MQKTVIVVMALALALVTFPATNVTAEERDREYTLTIGDVSGAQPDHSTTCSTMALLVLDLPPCGEEDHDSGWFTGLTIGFPGVNGDVTGTTVVTLNDGDVEFACTWNAGQISSCEIRAANWPAQGQPFTSTCFSEAGALGNWECFVEHT